MVYDIYYLLCFFMIYSFIGWCLEVAYAALTTGKLVNRGFLSGPVCPIYGFGMVGVLLTLLNVQDNLLFLFFGGMLLATAVELVGGWILDKLFHMRWWDYRSLPFNFKGYICLGFSVMWGLGAVGIVRIIHPIIHRFVSFIAFKAGVTLLVMSMILFIIDLLVTLKTVIGMTRSLGELEVITDRLHSVSDEMTRLLGGVVLDTSERLEEEKQNFEQWKENSQAVLDKKRAELERKMEELENRRRELTKKLQKGIFFGSGRMLKAFPYLHRSKSKEQLRDEIQKWKEERKQAE